MHTKVTKTHTHIKTHLIFVDLGIMIECECTFGSWCLFDFQDDEDEKKIDAMPVPGDTLFDILFDLLYPSSRTPFFGW